MQDGRASGGVTYRRLGAVLAAFTLAIHGVPLAAAPRAQGSTRRVELRVADAVVAQRLVAEGAEKLASYEAFSVLQVEEDQGRRLVAQGLAELAGGDGILLNVGRIDTTSPEAAPLRAAVGSFEGRRLHLVQFAAFVRPEWFEELQATGVGVVQYIPENAYLVYGDAQALARTQEMARTSPAVRWDGAYLDRYKVQPSAQAGQRAKLGLPGDRDRFLVQLVEDDGANAATLAVVAQRSLGPLVSRWPSLAYVNLVVDLPVGAVAAIAARPDVVSIDRYVEPTKSDERQDRIVTGQLAGNGPAAGDHLAYLASKGFTQAQFTASNFVVDVSDSGIDNATTTPNHFGLRLGGDLGQAGRVQYARLVGTPNGGTSTIQGCDGHGNINAHIVAGYLPDPATLPQPGVHADGSGFRYGLGVAPFVKVGSSVVFDPNTFTNPNLPNLQSSAYNDNARISSNSWGAAVGGAYNAVAQTFDALVRDAQPAGSTFPVAGNQEMVILFAAGNDGAGANTTGSPGTAKNVITVGASEGVQAFGGADGCGIGDAEADSANDMAAFSSRGPTDDGRVKPEIVAPGTHISGGVFQASATVMGTGDAASCFDASGVCAGAGSDFFPVGQEFYTASSGTSHSTPAVAGGAALVRQHFVNNGLAPASPAMTKAVLVNSARYMTGTAANDSLPSNAQGMGMMNLDTYFTQMAGARILRDQSGADLFTASGQQRVFTGNVADSGQPFRVTLAWTDAPGPTVGNAYVNDLDLEVTVGGLIYKGNVFAGASSSAGGTADPRNNVESVFVPAGVSGPFSVRVIATNIAGNGVPNVGGALDQDFALVVANATEVSQPVIGAGALTITADHCSASNGVLDPGETATSSLCLQNAGTADTINVVGTLQAAGGVTNPSGPQAYGVLVAGGAPVCRSFTWNVSNLACGAAVTPTMQVQDGPADLGNVSWSLPTGLPALTLAEDFDGVAAPALPAGWTTTMEAGTQAWTTVTTTPDTAPNAAFINDPGTVSLTSLVSPVIAVPVTPNPMLTFRHSYATEAVFDGGVLELKVGAGPFQDILAAGGSFGAGGYNATLSTCCSNPLPGRQAWSGNSGGYVTTTVNLPASVSGQSIQLRWRRGSDSTIAGTGWRVDTISLAASRVCCASSANLGITKSDGQSTYFPGQPLTYSIVAANAGPSGSGASVTDVLPAELTGASWTCAASAGSFCGSADGTGDIDAPVTLLPGGTATFTLGATASPGAAGSIVNTASIAGGAGVSDPNPANNTATDTDVRAGAAADVAITKTDGRTSYYPGQALTYTLTVTNAGPDASPGATVTDTFPADLTAVSWTCAASAGSSCASANGSGSLNTTVDLLAGGTATFTVDATASLAAAGSISNTATVANASAFDPNLGDNSATDLDTRVGGSYYTVTPCRVVDTRNPAGPLGGPALTAGASRSFEVAGHCGVPANATAVSLNLTVTGPTDAGFLQVFPTGATPPLVSAINYSADETRANNGVYSLGTGGQLDVRCGQASGTVHAIVDVSGYFVE